VYVNLETKYKISNISRVVRIFTFHNINQKNEIKKKLRTIHNSDLKFKEFISDYRGIIATCSENFTIL
jgi:hypothetical protein